MKVEGSYPSGEKYFGFGMEWNFEVLKFPNCVFNALKITFKVANIKGTDRLMVS